MNDNKGDTPPNGHIAHNTPDSIIRGGEVWYSTKAVSKILGYSNSGSISTLIRRYGDSSAFNNECFKMEDEVYQRWSNTTRYYSPRAIALLKSIQEKGNPPIDTPLENNAPSSTTVGDNERIIGLLEDILAEVKGLHNDICALMSLYR